MQNMYTLFQNLGILARVKIVKIRRNYGSSTIIRIIHIPNNPFGLLCIHDIVRNNCDGRWGRTGIHATRSLLENLVMYKFYEVLRRTRTPEGFNGFNTI
eukprot:48514-Ditylum_brightwellii.AAC.1